MRVAVLGCGGIGRFLMGAIQAGEAGAAELVALVGRAGREEKVRAVAAELSCRWTCDPAELAGMGVDLVVEAAGAEAVREYAVAILEAGMDLVLLSVGALADSELRSRVVAACRRSGRRVRVPSGAIGGLDALQGAAMARVEQVTLTTRKPPFAFAGTPYLAERGIDLTGLEAPVVIFEGSAEEAIKAFPANVNVSIALSLAGIGTGATRVRVVADPTARENTHEIEVSGEFGSFQVRMANRPLPANPRTSHLAALSALSLLRRLGDPIQIGC